MPLYVLYDSIEVQVEQQRGHGAALTDAHRGVESCGPPYRLPLSMSIHAPDNLNHVLVDVVVMQEHGHKVITGDCVEGLL